MNRILPGDISALRISGRAAVSLLTKPNRPLHPLDGRHKAPGRKPMAIRSANGAGATRPRHK